MGDKVVAGGRPGYWFPLVLLGFGLLGLLGWDSVRRGSDFGWLAYTPLPSYTGYGVSEDALVSAYVTIDMPSGLGRFPVQDSAWAVLVTVALVASAAWYGWRARRATGASGRAQLAVAAGGGIAVAVGYVAAGVAGTVDEPAKLITSVGLPLAGLGALAVAWAYFRLGSGRRVAVAVIGAGCLVVAFATMLGAWAPGLFLPVVIAGGLLALARFERSRLLAVAAVAVLAAMVVFPAGTLSMLIPAALMLAAAIVALARQVGAGAPA
jgi:hypothetical protein